MVQHQPFMPLESSTKPHRGQTQGNGEKVEIRQGTRYPLTGTMP
jgi:hypothetical protein